MAFGLPKIVYTPVATPITVPFPRAARNFCVSQPLVVNDNVSDSGLRERIVITGPTEILMVDFDLLLDLADSSFVTWDTFLQSWALIGGVFKFYPNVTVNQFFNCWLDNTAWKPVWKAPTQYAEHFTLRAVPDGTFPAAPAVSTVLGWFYGL